MKRITNKQSSLHLFNTTFKHYFNHLKNNGTKGTPINNRALHLKSDVYANNPVLVPVYDPTRILVIHHIPIRLN